jgi:hypothetical protein
MHYYETVAADDLRWHLSMRESFTDGTPTDLRVYGWSKPIVEPKPVPFSIQIVGRPVEFNPTTFGALVLSKRAADLISGSADHEIQRIPAEINGPGEWEVVNTLSVHDSIDHERSIIQYYPLDHHRYPGEPRGVVKLVLDPARIPPDSHIFKPRGWLVTTIVSEALRNAFEEHDISGVEFVRVT